MGNGGIGKCFKKVAPAPIKSNTTTNLEIKPTETLNGCCRLYAGVRTENNQYTCPILSVQTWHKGMQNIKSESGVLHTVGITGGSMLDRGRETTMMTNAKEKVEYKVGVDVQICVIPVEDIISVNITTEVKKGVEQKKTARRKVAPSEELSGCQKVKKCCVKNIFCCCDNEVLPTVDYEVKTTQKQDATRTITVTIKHCRYGLVDTPSNVRVLAKEKQTAFYQEQLHVDTVKFYYLKNEVFDQAEYNKDLQESEALARLVMQLKAMNNHYPDEVQLQKIIDQHHLKHFGQKLTEDIPVLEGTAEVSTVVSRTDT